MYDIRGDAQVWCFLEISNLLLTPDSLSTAAIVDRRLP